MGTMLGQIEATQEVTNADRRRRLDEDAGDAEARRLFEQLTSERASSASRRQVRNRLVELHLGVAEQVARRFQGRGEPLDDLVQVAVLGLIQAVDRFDPQRGVEFTSFAVPTIRGVIKRHFRDNAWLLHVPRRLKQLHLALNAGQAELTQTLGRSPILGELAAHLRAPEDEVAEALDLANAYGALSLDAGRPDGHHEPGSASLAELIPDDDEPLETVEYRQLLRPLLHQLPSQQRTILYLRFFADWTQAQIAEELGVSQVHVSRLLTRLLGSLRSVMPRGHAVAGGSRFADDPVISRASLSPEG